MTWYSHKVLTFIAVFEISRDLIFAVLSAVFSVIPDMVEGKMFVNGVMNKLDYQKWKERHRRLSHWWVVYTTLLVVGASVSFVYKQAGYMLIALSVGSICHILEDALSGRVPLLSPRRKSFGIRLVKTGGVGEKLLVFSVIMLFIAIEILSRGGLKSWSWN